jgi:hypothetical protein
MSKLIELAVAELNKNNIHQIYESDNDPMIHVYSSKYKPTGGMTHKHLETMKLSDANKKYETDVSHKHVSPHNQIGIGTHEGATHDLPHIPTPGRRALAYVHASHPIEK